MLAKPELDRVGNKLLQAADLIKTFGFFRANSPDVKGRYCALLAICEVCDFFKSTERREHIHPDFYIACGRVRSHLKEVHNWNRSIQEWNDIHSKEEVINMLKEAAYHNLQEL